MGRQWKQWQTLFLGGSKITADGDCSHEIKRCLLLGRRAMTNLDNILKSRDSQFSSVQFSHSVVSNRVHTRPPCPSLNPGVYSKSYPLSPGCHPTISSPVIPFSSRLQSFPASFPMSQFFASGGQSIGVSASASLLPMNIQG